MVSQIYSHQLKLLCKGHFYYKFKRSMRSEFYLHVLVWFVLLKFWVSILCLSLIKIMISFNLHNDKNESEIISSQRKLVFDSNWVELLLIFYK